MTLSVKMQELADSAAFASSGIPIHGGIQIILMTDCRKYDKILIKYVL